MAMIDYGAIGFKNGKLISTGMFTPMIDTVGWEDCEEDLMWEEDIRGEKRSKPLELKDNYFLYIGDKDYTIAFYKTFIDMIERNKRIDEHNFTVKCEGFNWSNYTGWKAWDRWFGEYSDKGKYDNHIVVKPKNGYYVLRWNYRGNKYKVYFGYGVDLAWYKKTHMINYFRTCPKAIWRRFKWRVKDKFTELKWRFDR